MRHLILITLIPFLVGALCNLRQNTVLEDVARASDSIEEVVPAFLAVTPFLTSTPTATLTPTPTLSPTIEGGNIGDNGGDDTSNGDDTEQPDNNSNNGPPDGQPPPPPVQPPPLPTPLPPPLETPGLPPPTIEPPPTGRPPLPPPPPTRDDGGGNGPDPERPTAEPPTTEPPTAEPPTAAPPTAEPPTATPTAAPPTATPTNTPEPPQVAFGVGTVDVSEGDPTGTAVISVTLSTTTTNVVTVSFSTGTGSAFVGVDYVPSSGTLTFAPGEQLKFIAVPLLNDSVDDPDVETIPLLLENPVNATLGLAQATLNVVDDDPLPNISFAAVTYTTAENVAPQITVQLDRPSGKVFAVGYGPNGNGTATANVDYSLTAIGLEVFSPDPTGVSLTTFTFTWVGLLDDTLVEPNETVELELSSANNVTLASPFVTTLTIVDDD